ncbi:GNAT family N-acetyltransferase [Aquicoccus sp. SU-CL01552]|uniref:GNAT family N-acetyltransferase n=1 Tax=Aquicoccus sp. SU-CL01552 TaxID=3127656 RepID=UPI003108F99A
MTGFALPIPVIETERLVLRGPREDDFEAHLEFATSERSKFVGGPSDRWQAWQGFCTGIAHWVLRGYGFWLIEDKATGSTLGKTGFICHDGWPEPELGWHVYGNAEGKGIAFEAAQAARAYGAEHFGLERVISHIAPENVRSIALAERLGAVFERESELLGRPCFIYRHPVTEAA